MECIVKFDVVYKQEIKSLRGLIFVSGEALPTAEQITKMFKDMKYDVVPDPADPMIYVPVQPQGDLQHIRIRELDTGDTRYTEDRDLKNIVSNLLPTKHRPM